MNIIGIFILFAHWSNCVDRNDKVLPSKVLIKIVMHIKKWLALSNYEIQNTFILHVISFVFSYLRIYLRK